MKTDTPECINDDTAITMEDNGCYWIEQGRDSIFLNKDDAIKLANKLLEGNR